MGTHDLLKKVIRPAAKAKVSLAGEAHFLKDVTVGVEVAGWLHRGALCRARDVVICYYII